MDLSGESVIYFYMLDDNLETNVDLCVRIEDNTIVYKFYKKAVSNPVLMRQDSAMPDRIKRNAVVQEGIRRLRNT